MAVVMFRVFTAVWCNIGATGSMMGSKGASPVINNRLRPILSVETKSNLCSLSSVPNLLKRFLLVVPHEVKLETKPPRAQEQMKRMNQGSVHVIALFCFVGLLTMVTKFLVLSLSWIQVVSK